MERRDRAWEPLRQAVPGRTGTTGTPNQAGLLNRSERVASEPLEHELPSAPVRGVVERDSMAR
jgi:hypothetical protein